MKEATTTSKEDYLKTILEAEAEGHTVIPALIAHWMKVSPPAVTMAVKRLRRDGLVETGPNGVLRLTEAGRATAYRTALRHHLIERMLSEIFGMEWYQIHEEAERLEHAVSPVFEAKLREKLGELGDCPHGNAILPAAPAVRRQRGERPLTEAIPGTRYTVVSIQERDPLLLAYLHQAGIGPGVGLAVSSYNPDQTISIQLDRSQTALGRSAGEAVWIREPIPV
jgi:DtxR family Mn-dependent transcriptional regulator